MGVRLNIIHYSLEVRIDFWWQTERKIQIFDQIVDSTLTSLRDDTSILLRLQKLLENFSLVLEGGERGRRPPLPEIVRSSYRRLQ